MGWGLWLGLGLGSGRVGVRVRVRVSLGQSCHVRCQCSRRGSGCSASLHLWNLYRAGVLESLPSLSESSGSLLLAGSPFSVVAI